MNNKIVPSEEKITKINYYGLIFVFFGTGNLLCYHILTNVPGSIVAVIRVLIMIVLLAFVTTVSKNWRKIDKEDWLPLIIGGVLSFGSYTLFLASGLQKTSLINGSILTNTSPVFSMFFAVIFKQEKWSWPAFAGAVIAFAGVCIASFGGSPEKGDSITGDLFVLIASCSLALGTVYSHKSGKKFHPYAQTSIMGFFGLIFLVIFSITDFMNIDWHNVINKDWLMMIYIGSFGGAVIFGCYFKSVEIFGASATMVFLFLTIPFSALLNYIILEKVPGLNQITGAVIVLAGAGWSIYERSKEGKMIQHYHHI